jgi:RNA polymerase sigma-70 factor (ECF subfamily)
MFGPIAWIRLLRHYCAHRPVSRLALLAMEAYRRNQGETRLQQQESCELVRDCVNQLPENFRTVLLLRDIEGLDTEETAQLLGTSLGVVKTRLHRGRGALRTLLDPHFRRGNV